MIDKNERDASFEYSVPQLNNEGQYDRDEAGNIVLVPETLNIERKEVAGEVRYHVSYNQRTEVWSLFERPSWKHLLGTDGDSYDVIARIMYGGRISLLVGFVVVFLETILGVLMGGLAGFFGGWVDTLIMRLVDIFYCIPTMPIMIILASVFDQQQVKPYIRLLWMMVVLGILGWSGIARLVRGQILSLREQEFMTAAEATGLKTGRRIFKHLVPNVMPQLIVSMTMGLGGVILLESTLSYLGLGVKHPYATWGNMINSVSDIESMKSYTYIWIPVGVLICLAVIAFNFVGDGLRDAFDPKMKR
ncbi:MAG: ABC transporter permease [Clostridia bacterium]|nr:ABC transporter permease [Clostridia bacterium]